MRVLSRVLIVFLLVGAAFACRPPAKDYKLTRQQSRRIHQDEVYYRTKADKKMDEEKAARREAEKERLEHNIKVANSRNPARKMAAPKKNAPFSHH